ncbi:MAG: FliM/FliN family flagellar motor switch protein [Parasphingorhabdus sp.]|uniref:FliM/FliN family flagellar motor switch protein n=1 Tax=Parasphingorhabdus sp. TaxID=2709688 RepID=UPI0032979CE1
MSNAPSETISADTDNDSANAPPIEHSLLKKGGPDDHLLSAYRKVEKRLANQLKSQLMAFVSADLAIEMTGNETLQFPEWLQSIEGDAVYLEYHNGPSGPPIWVRISRTFLSGCVDCFFGGQFDGNSSASGKLSRSETAIIERLGKAIGDSLIEGWSVICETSFRYAGYIQDKDDLEMDLDDPNILISAASATLCGHAVEAFHFAQPIDGLVAIEPQLHRPVSRETNSVDPVWQRSLKDSFDQVYMPVRSVLARPTMNLSQLSQLSVGDVLPVSPTDNVPLIIGDRVFAHGSIGEQNGGVAFKIKQFL